MKSAILISMLAAAGMFAGSMPQAATPAGQKTTSTTKKTKKSKKTTQSSVHSNKMANKSAAAPASNPSK